MSQPLNLAVRSYLLRKNLVAIPFELLGAAAALIATTELKLALLYFFAGSMAGGVIGKRVAQVSSLLDNFTAKEIKDFQISRPMLTGLLLFLVPCVVAFVTWRAGLAQNQIVGWAGIAWSIAQLAYRYFAFVKERSEVVNA